MAEYHVVPFAANIGSDEGAGRAAEQLQSLINQKASDGWRFHGLESVEIYKTGSAGCFGIGAQPSSVTRFDMAVFER